MKTLFNWGLAAALCGYLSFSSPVLAENGRNAAFFVGLAAGALAGAAIAGGTAAPAYAPGPPVYSPHHCWYQVQPLFDAAGHQVSSQSVRRCD